MARLLKGPAPGVLLVAPPVVVDPNFQRSVVLMCEHTDDGSFGLILNRPIRLSLESVVEGIVASDNELAFGGPVQTDTLHFLHTFGPMVTNAEGIADGVFWGGTFEDVKTLLSSGGVSPDDLRFFIGYAGWSPGQLEFEIDEGGWILAEGDRSLIFSTPPDALWRTVMIRLGGAYALLANYPLDPRLN